MEIILTIILVFAVVIGTFGSLLMFISLGILTGLALSLLDQGD